MSRSGIEYLDAVVNPYPGCQSIGCPYCWARRAIQRQAANPCVNLTALERAKLMKFEPVFLPERLRELSKWRHGRVVGVNFMGDLFGHWASDEEVMQVLVEVIRNPQHTFVFLTRRTNRLAEIFNCQSPVSGNAAKNIFLGATCTDQPSLIRASGNLNRIAEAGWNTWLSLEPMQSEMDLLPVIGSVKGVVLGGPSGPKAWAIDPLWVSKIRNQCQAAGVPFYFKQWGTWVPCAHQWYCDLPNCEAMCRRTKGGLRVVRAQRGERALLDGRIYEALPWKLTGAGK